MKGVGLGHDRSFILCLRFSLQLFQVWFEQIILQYFLLAAFLSEFFFTIYEYRVNSAVWSLKRFRGFGYYLVPAIRSSSLLFLAFLRRNFYI